MSAKNQPVFYWVAAVFFFITTILYIREGYWIKTVSSVCMVVAFVLLAMYSRLQIPAMRWFIWLLLAAALSIQLLTLIDRFGFNDQLF